MFNAISYIKELEKAGLSRDGAEIMMKCQIDMMNDHFATKQDIYRLESKFEKIHRELKAELKADIEAVRTELTLTINKVQIDINKDLGSKIHKTATLLGIYLSVFFGILFYLN